MKLSLLICTIPSRFAMFSRLQAELWSQMLPYAGDIELILDGDSGTIGEKRNRLLDKAVGDYVAYIDDDDSISLNYIQLLMDAIQTDCDCASLKGLYSIDGNPDGIFEHSIKYHEWKTVVRVNHGIRSYLDNVKYERYPNHLNMIRSSIAKQFRFPEINHGEDKDWSTQIHESGLLKKEHYIEDVIYFYRFNSKK